MGSARRGSESWKGVKVMGEIVKGEDLVMMLDVVKCMVGGFDDARDRGD